MKGRDKWGGKRTTLHYHISTCLSSPARANLLLSIGFQAIEYIVSCCLMLWIDFSYRKGEKEIEKRSGFDSEEGVVAVVVVARYGFSTLTEPLDFDNCPIFTYLSSLEKAK